MLQDYRHFINFTGFFFIIIILIDAIKTVKEKCVSSLSWEGPAKRKENKKKNTGKKQKS